MKRAVTLTAVVLGAALGAAPTASAAVRELWVAAVPAPKWNIVPNGRDAITGTRYPASQTVFPTVVYRRYTKGWKRPLGNARANGPGQDLIPGPLIRARVGDRIVVRFKNLDTLYKRSHSMHFHGVRYRPSSDGAYVPGYSGGDGDVKPGKTWTYRLRAGKDAVGSWPYHDHSPSMRESILGGMYGMLSILGRNERVPDRELTVIFAPIGKFQSINGRAFVGNTPVMRARVGQLVQWNVMAIGSEFHTFHVHGHRWQEGGITRDTKTVGPAESFRIRWVERDPGTWLYHCHVEDHMENGMVGIYQALPR